MDTDILQPAGSNGVMITNAASAPLDGADAFALSEFLVDDWMTTSQNVADVPGKGGTRRRLGFLVVLGCANLQAHLVHMTCRAQFRQRTSHGSELHT